VVNHFLAFPYVPEVSPHDLFAQVFSFVPLFHLLGAMSEQEHVKDDADRLDVSTLVLAALIVCEFGGGEEQIAGTLLAGVADGCTGLELHQHDFVIELAQPQVGRVQVAVHEAMLVQLLHYRE